MLLILAEAEPLPGIPGLPAATEGRAFPRRAHGEATAEGNAPWPPRAAHRSRARHPARGQLTKRNGRHLLGGSLPHGATAAGAGGTQVKAPNPVVLPMAEPARPQGPPQQGPRPGRGGCKARSCPGGACPAAARVPVSGGGDNQRELRAHRRRGG